ncbi:hypothetical protein B0H19DRAFT_1105821 [Mycena capillaripes]|nr:hypothetical protein B0H19DRAFT_1105821 [Mycena capillaripes]
MAREFGLLSILPLTYCMMVSTQRDTYMPTILDAKDVRLGAGDWSACLRGYAHLLEMQSTTTMAWLKLDMPRPHIPSKACSQPGKCVAAVHKIIIDRSNTGRPDVRIFNHWDKDWGTGMCKHCRKGAKEIYEAGRKTCWKELPAAFELPSWEELNALDLE